MNSLLLQPHIFQVDFTFLQISILRISTYLPWGTEIGETYKDQQNNVLLEENFSRVPADHKPIMDTHIPQEIICQLRKKMSSNQSHYT